MSSIVVQLPDGSERELPAGATAYDLAADIGPGLAKAFVNKKAQFTVDTSHAGSHN